MLATEARPLGLLANTLAYGSYKEWLHVNVFHHQSGTVGLINASLHAEVADPRSLAMGVALFYRPGVGWAWHTDLQQAATANLGWASIGLPTVAVAVDLPERQVAASVVGGAVRGHIRGLPAVAEFDVPRRLPFGSGWISWNVLPRLRLDGVLIHEGAVLDLAGASGYSDRNWGRWFWGDDAGWEWGAFEAADRDLAVVLSRGTNRAHRIGRPLVTVHRPGRTFTFREDAVGYRSSGCFREALVRVPGAMAALHAGRRSPHLPDRIDLDLRGGHDALRVTFQVRAAAQIVAAEPTRPGYAFLQELVGECEITGRLSGEPVAGQGLGVYEYVD